jgi:hypothetical protein
MQGLATWLNGVLATAWAGIIIIAACTMWFLVSYFTNGGTLIHNGHFDPGMTVGGYLMNAVQLVYLWVTSVAAIALTKHAKAQLANSIRQHNFHAHTHRKLEKIAQQLSKQAQ